MKNTKTPISDAFIEYQDKELADPEAWKALCEEAISQFRNKLANEPLMKKMMRERSRAGKVQYGDSSFLTLDFDLARAEEVADIMNYTQMEEFATNHMDGKGTTK